LIEEFPIFLIRGFAVHNVMLIVELAVLAAVVTRCSDSKSYFVRYDCGSLPEVDLESGGRCMRLDESGGLVRSRIIAQYVFLRLLIFRLTLLNPRLGVVQGVSRVRTSKTRRRPGESRNLHQPAADIIMALTSTAKLS
jgi:hypothetical protein